MKTLKEYLKTLAIKIRTSKRQQKDYQRNHRGIHDYKLMREIYEFKYDYRHRHIAYCIMKGTARDRIEQPAEDNKPNEKRIQEIIDEFTKTTQDVCASA